MFSSRKKLHVPIPSSSLDGFPHHSFGQTQGVLGRLLLLASSTGGTAGVAAGRVDAALCGVANAFGRVTDGVGHAFGRVSDCIPESANWVSRNVST